MRRQMLNQIKLNDKEMKKVCSELEAYYLAERGEEIGIIEQQQLIEFIMTNIAPVIYNRALNDAQSWFKNQCDNMEADYYLLYKDTEE